MARRRWRYGLGDLPWLLTSRGSGVRWRSSGGFGGFGGYDSSGSGGGFGGAGGFGGFGGGSSGGGGASSDW